MRFPLRLVGAVACLVGMSAVPAGPAAAALPSTLVAIAPQRVVDTRAATKLGYDGDRPRAGDIVTVTLAGAGHPLPPGATTAVVNVTATNAGAAGYVTVWNCAGAGRPGVSNLNVTPGETTANLVVSELSAEGDLCLYTQSSVDLIVDVTGYATAPATFSPLRVFDSRTDPPQPGLGGSPRPRQAGEVFDFKARSPRSGPEDFSSVVLNLTSVGAIQNGFVTVYPCDGPRPGTSNLGVVAGVTVAGAAVVEIGDLGEVCVFTSVATDLVVDLLLYGHDGDLVPVAPTRLADTRLAPTTPAFPTALQAGMTLAVDPRPALPVTPAAVVVTVTGTDATTAGYVTVWPCGQPRPLASTLNLTPGRSTANVALVRLGADGTICIYTQAPADIVVDLFGYLS